MRISEIAQQSAGHIFSQQPEHTLSGNVHAARPFLWKSEDPSAQIPDKKSGCTTGSQGSLSQISMSRLSGKN
jgi:hypothetical protein